MKTIPFFALIALFAASACKPKEDADLAPTEVSNMVTLTDDQMKNISFDTAKMIGEEENLTLTGKISFDESKVERIFPLVGGNVEKVMVSLGDYVHKGQVLAVIRSTEINDLQSQYAVAQNTENVAKKNLDIAEELFKTSTYSEVQVNAARHDYNSAESEVKRLQQALSVYGANATSGDALYDVVAPIDGYVVEKNINENMDIRSDNGANIFTVSELNTVWVLANVYENDLSKVTAGEPVEIKTIAYPDTVFKGTIQHVDMVLDSASKVARARIILDNSKGLLRPEMFAEVKVHIALPTQKVSVAIACVVFQNSANYVVVHKSGNTFEKRLVKIGDTSSTGRVYILDGVQPGEILIAKGSLYVANN